jgi:hypothetical protein
MKRRIVISLTAALAVAGLLYEAHERGASNGGDWRTANRAPVGLAPAPAATPEAVIQLYAARTVRWRGYFGVHTWIATKAANAREYTVYEVLGWRLRRGASALAVSHRPPDESWFGHAPELLLDIRGPPAGALIARIDQAAHSYPYLGEYRVWPGPNSNTFTAYVLRHVPELHAELPAIAIGKDYLGWRLVAGAPSGTGWQVNLFGVLGVLVATREGVEINVLGLVFGIDPPEFSLKLPFAGRLGLLPRPIVRGTMSSTSATGGLSTSGVTQESRRVLPGGKRSLTR